MNESVQGLLSLFDLEKLEENLFRGQSKATGQRSVFGGLVAGQAVLAASQTVPEDRPIHSLHAYFLRPGDFTLPIVYDVDRIRDGGSFTTRRVRAIQHGRPIFSMAASFQTVEKGVEHQAEMPPVPGPDEVGDDLTDRERVAASLPEQYREAFLQEKPVEFRPVRPRDSLSLEPHEPLREAWFRVRSPIEVSPLIHRALLAFCSDFGLMTTAMLPHQMGFWQPDVQAASIDHTMWFHNDCKVDEWLLYRSESPWAGGGRGMNFGGIYRQDGVRVASVAQEGLMRKVNKP